MKRIEMVRFGAEQLFVAENAIEMALSDTAALVSSLGRMRVDAGMSAMIGQKALEETVNSMMALTKAREAIVRAHSELDEIKTMVGCGAVSVGPSQTKPPKDGDASVLVRTNRMVA